jgi:ABC-type oligopeptide transport system substrate-binding subunit
MKEMKKMFFVVFAFMCMCIATGVTSCGNSTSVNTVDSTTVDSVESDSVLLIQ